MPETLPVSDDDTSPVRVPIETDRDTESDWVFVVDADTAFVTEEDDEKDGDTVGVGLRPECVAEAENVREADCVTVSDCEYVAERECVTDTDAVRVRVCDNSEVAVTDGVRVDVIDGDAADKDGDVEFENVPESVGDALSSWVGEVLADGEWESVTEALHSIDGEHEKLELRDSDASRDKLPNVSEAE